MRDNCDLHSPDAIGNIGTATQVVTITDTTAPVITAPAAVTADSADGNPVAATIGVATATDLFTVTITSDAPASFPVGITTVTWTATDANGNTSTATQLVTVNLLDTVPPVITVPANVYASTSTSQATVDIGIASANDNVDGMVAVTNDAPATYPIGVTTVTYTSSDSAGNTATATQQVYVSYSSTVGGGSGGTTTPPPAGGGATVGMEAVYFHHNDHLGTPQALTDINGTKVWEMSQTPFGIATVNEDVDGDGLTVTNNFRFPGQYYDAETGLYYNYFRSYDPKGGVYPQHDLIGLNDGMNPFAYVKGNPVNRMDTLGLWSTLAHNYFIDQAYGVSLTASQRQALKDGSRFADSLNFQASSFSYMHAMSSSAHNKVEAMKMYNAFLSVQKKSYCSLLNQENEYKAYFELGMGLHAIMDSTSPAHRGFQSWDVNLKDVGSWGDAFDHGGLAGSSENGWVAREYRDETVNIMKQYFSPAR